MDFKCTLETRTSKKGDPYTCLVVSLPRGVEKIVWLTTAELALIESADKKSDSPIENDFIDPFKE